MYDFPCGRKIKGHKISSSFSSHCWLGEIITVCFHSVRSHRGETMIWLLIDVNYEELDKMETGRSQVCNGSFGSFTVGRKSLTRTKTAPPGTLFHVTMVNGVYSTAWLLGGKEGA